MAILQSFRAQAAIAAIVLAAVLVYFLSAGHRVTSPLELTSRPWSTNVQLSNTANKTLGVRIVRYYAARFLFID
jgi:hypothetical protein